MLVSKKKRKKKFIGDDFIWLLNVFYNYCLHGLTWRYLFQWFLWCDDSYVYKASGWRRGGAAVCTRPSYWWSVAGNMALPWSQTSWEPRNDCLMVTYTCNIVRHPIQVFCKKKKSMSSRYCYLSYFNLAKLMLRNVLESFMSYWMNGP